MAKNRRAPKAAKPPTLVPAPKAAEPTAAEPEPKPEAEPPTIEPATAEVVAAGHSQDAAVVGETGPELFVPTVSAPQSVTSDDEPDELAELGLTVDPDGLVTLEMLTGLSGPELTLSPRDPYRCKPAEAVRLARVQFARAGKVEE